MEILSDKTVKARKEHWCQFCESEISTGSLYRKQVNKIDGIQTFKTHESCRQLSEKLNMYDNEEGYVDSCYFTETVNAIFSAKFPESIAKFPERLKVLMEENNIKTKSN